MTVVLVAILVVLWAIVIGSYVKDRASHRTSDSVSAFRDQLHTLQRTQPGGRRGMHRAPRSDSFAPVAAFGPGRPLTRAQVGSPQMRQRRRDILIGLAGAAAFTFLCALVVGSTPLIAVNVLFDLALAGYVLALVQQQRIAQERQVKVRYLPHGSAGATGPRATRPAARAVGAPASRPSRPARVPSGVEPAMLRRSAVN